MKPKTQSHPARKPKCVNPDCPSKGEEYSRGLCELCYRSLRHLIVKTNRLPGGWKEAEDRGLCRAPKPAGMRRFPVVAAAKVNGTKGR